MDLSEVRQPKPDVQMLRNSDLIPGRNPRSYFDPAELAELTESIRIHRVQTPLLVRPLNGKFEIVFGERRWRANTAAFGADGELPCMVREMSDEEAETLSLIENIQRADMSATEEAVWAKRILTRNKGDREETARLLGWTMQKLTRRLALTVLDAQVINALNERRIQLGHAELLCALGPDKQKAALATILEHGLSVDYVRQYIAKYSQSLADAVFDRSECESCQFNSTRQRALFSQAVQDGHCTNPPCFEAKTQKRLQDLLAAAAEESPCAKIIGPGEENLFAPVHVEGEHGVGPEQYETGCRACANFGAAVLATPQRMGVVEKEVCFDPGCRQKMIAAHIKAAHAASLLDKNTTEPAQAAGGPRVGSRQRKLGQAGAVPQAIVEYRRKIWREIAQHSLVQQPDKARAYGIALAVSGKARDISSSVMKDILLKLADLGDFESLPGELGNLARLIAGQKPDVLDKLTTAMAVAAIRESDHGYLTDTLVFLGADMADHWRLNADFLKLLTKSEIEAVCGEIGLAQHLGDQFRKIIGKKKDDAISALLGVEDFDYTGKIPRSMQYDSAK